MLISCLDVVKIHEIMEFKKVTSNCLATAFSIPQKKTTKMASAAGVIKTGVKQVRPLLSVDNAEARKRVLNLYKAWYRQIPYIGIF